MHQSFPDFTFLTGNWIGKMMKLKGEIDPAVAMDLSNRASLAFLQRHLGEPRPPAERRGRSTAVACPSGRMSLPSHFVQSDLQ